MSPVAKAVSANFSSRHQVLKAGEKDTHSSHWSTFEKAHRHGRGTRFSRTASEYTKETTKGRKKRAFSFYGIF
ncbi:hypothetical protein Chor_005452 [Crotalus horridus]